MLGNRYHLIPVDLELLSITIWELLLCLQSKSFDFFQCNCDIVDGRPRKDIGVVTEPKDLPIGSVTFNDIGESSAGEYFVAPLKCGRQEFGKQSVKSTLGIMWNHHFSWGDQHQWISLVTLCTNLCPQEHNKL